MKMKSKTMSVIGALLIGGVSYGAVYGGNGMSKPVRSDSSSLLSQSFQCVSCIDAVKKHETTPHDIDRDEIKRLKRTQGTDQAKAARRVMVVKAAAAKCLARRACHGELEHLTQSFIGCKDALQNVVKNKAPDNEWNTVLTKCLHPFADFPESDNDFYASTFEGRDALRNDYKGKIAGLTGQVLERTMATADAVLRQLELAASEADKVTLITNAFINNMKPFFEQKARSILRNLESVEDKRSYLARILQRSAKTKR
jgi:hypothetical protein